MTTKGHSIEVEATAFYIYAKKSYNVHFCTLKCQTSLNSSLLMQLNVTVSTEEDHMNHLMSGDIPVQSFHLSIPTAGI